MSWLNWWPTTTAILPYDLEPRIVFDGGKDGRLMQLFPPREHFVSPERLSPAWTLERDHETAECVVWSHQFGFELRLTARGELRSQVCVTEQDLIAVQEEWRAALEAKGWTKA